MSAMSQRGVTPRKTTTAAVFAAKATPAAATRAARMTLAIAAALTALTLPATAGSAAAQDHRLSLTGYLGAASYSSLADSADPGVFLESGGFNGGMAELWFGRLGLRLHAGWAETPVDDEPGTRFGIVAGDADLVVRFRRPRPDLFFQPYGVIGLGAVRYDLDLDTSLVGGYAYESDPTVRGSLVLGLGADFLDGPVGGRLELMDIIGVSSPLSRTDTSHFGPVSHVVLTLGLTLRAGHIALPPPTERPRPVPTRLTRPDTTAPPRDTTRARPDTTAADTVRPPIRRPAPPPIDTTVTVDTTPPPPEGPRPVPPDTTRRPPPGQPIAPPGDTTRIEPPDTTGPPPVDTAGPPPIPMDSTRPRPPVRPPIRPPEAPPTDTTVTVDTAGPPPDTTQAPPDTTDAPPTDTTAAPPADTVETPVDTTDAGEGGRGRLFTVRVEWDPDDGVQAAAVDAVVAVLREAGVPVWPVEPDSAETGQGRQGRGGGPEGAAHRRAGAFRNAADARTLGNHIEAEYGLGWEWVHIPRDEDIPAEAIAASEAFVSGLQEGPGRGGRGGRPGGGSDGRR